MKHHKTLLKQVNNKRVKINKKIKSFRIKICKTIKIKIKIKNHSKMIIAKIKIIFKTILIYFN